LSGNDPKAGAGLMRESRQMTPETAPQRQAQTDYMAAPAIEPAAGRNESENDDMFDDFTGFYAGGDVGYQIGSAEVGGGEGDVGLDGFNGGLFAGYGFSHSFGWLGGYAGVEAGYEWSGADGDLGGTSFEKDHAWLVTFRPGLTMHEDTMAYGILGYSRAEFEAGADDENLDGLVLGAGAEFDTDTAFKTRLEYTYTNYEDASIGGTDFDEHENNIKLGLLFRF
jgi:opacity protein-like surface antigen